LAGREINELMYKTLGKIAKLFPQGLMPSNSQALVVGAKEFVWEPKKKPSSGESRFAGQAHAAEVVSSKNGRSHNFQEKRDSSLRRQRSQ
jgi:hypothetical protein